MTTALPLFDQIDGGNRHGTLYGAPVISLGDAAPSRGHCVGLIPCDDWDAADWRLPCAAHDVAVNVEITGRTLKGYTGRFVDATGWKRARITFVGDGEADRTVPGWVRVI